LSAISLQVEHWGPFLFLAASVAATINKIMLTVNESGLIFIVLVDYFI
jgi:hypothetical protein